MRQVGSYLALLQRERKKQDPTVTNVALGAIVGVESNYLWRIRKGVIKNPSDANIQHFVELLGGQRKHVDFLAQPGCTDADVRRCVAEALAARPTLDPLPLNDTYDWDALRRQVEELDAADREQFYSFLEPARAWLRKQLSGSRREK